MSLFIGGSPSILRLVFSIANAIHLTFWRSLSLSYWHYFYNSSGKIFWPAKHLRLKRKHLVIQLSSFLAHNRPHVARWTNQQTCGYNVNDEEEWGKTSIFLKMIYQWQTSQKSLFSKKSLGTFWGILCLKCIYTNNYFTRHKNSSFLKLHQFYGKEINQLYYAPICLSFSWNT